MTSVPSEFDLPALLGEEPFVRGLARSLLFDDHQVDDAVQQTWLEALKARRVTRSWLGTVVRSRASNLKRNQRRAEARERVAARVEALPSTEELLEREELRRRVVEAVSGLPETYRVVILMRFYEELPIRKIAQELELPRETVATRLKRGLGMLRERLDASHGGDRNAWATAIVPLALPPMSAAGIGVTGALVGKLGNLTGAILAMKHLLFALAGLAALLIGLGYSTDLFSSERPDPVAIEPTVAERGAVDPVVEQPVVVEAEVSTSVRDDVTVPSRRAGGFASVREALAGFTGRVVGPDGTPATDELVRLIGLDPVHGLGSIFDPDRRGEGVVDSGTRSAAARTDEDGVFTIEDVRPDALYALHAAVGGVHPTWQMVERTAGPGQLVDLGVIRLEAKGSVVGHVVDEDGEPVEGAEIWAADIPGAILSVAPVDRLRAGGAMLIAVPRIELDAGADKATLVQYHAEIRSHFNKMVPTADDSTDFVPLELPSWFERFFDELPLARTRTDADGAFELRGVDPGGVAIMIHADGFLDATKPRVRVDANAQRSVGTIKLRAGDTCAGTVLDAEGRAIAGAQIRLANQPNVGMTGILFASQPLDVGADGGFEMTGLPREDLFIAARRDVGSPWIVHGPFDSDDEEIEIRFEPTESVTLQVRSGGENEITDVRVVVRKGPPLGELSVSGLQRELPVRVTSEGSVATVHDLDPGDYTLQVQAADHVLGIEYVHVRAEMEPIEVELEPVARGVVQVVDGDGNAIEGAQVFVQNLDTPAWARSVLFNYGEIRRWDQLARFAGFSGVDGRLELDCLHAGDAWICVRHPAFGAGGTRVDWPVAEGDVVVTMEACSAVFGQVFDSGKPADGKKYRLIAKRTENELPMPSVGGQAVIGEDGSYRFDGLMPGPYRIRVKDSLGDIRSLGDLIGSVEFGWSWSLNPRDVEAELLPGQEHELSFDLDPDVAPAGTGGRAHFHVTVDGRPAVGYKVMKEHFPSRELGVLDANGAFVTDEMVSEPEEFGITTPDGTVIWKRSVKIEPQTTVDVRVALEFSRVRGVVTRVGGVPAANHPVIVYSYFPDGGQAHRVVQSNAAGAYEVRTPAGECVVSIEGVGGTAVTERFPVAPGATVTRNVQLSAEKMFTGRVIGAPDDVEIRWITFEGEGWKRYEMLDGDTFSVLLDKAGTYKIQVLDSSMTGYDAIPSEIRFDTAGLLDQVVRVGELAK